MAIRRIETNLSVSGETEYKRKISEVNRSLSEMKSEMQYVEEVFKDQSNSTEALTAKNEILRREVEQQEEKVRALSSAVEDATKAYKEGDKRLDDWRQSLTRAQTELIKLNRELENNEQYLDEAKRSSDGYAKSIDGMGREVDQSAGLLEGLNDGLTGLLGSSGPAIGAMGAVAGGATALVGTIMEVVESTEEYRKIMGTLEVSSQAAGYTTEQTEEAYNRLYAVLGDTQSAATTLANLQAIGLGQEELMDVIDDSIGAWAKYGDSIPIDGLAEAINETIKAGQVTGNFADVLNWGAKEGETYGVKLRAANDANEEWNNAVNDATSAEDFFNLALQECETQSERVDLVMRTLADQGLADAAESWFELNQDIVDSNLATDNLDRALGELGETLSPLAAKLKDFGAGAIGGVTEFIQDLIGGIGDLKQSVSDASTSAQYIADRFTGKTSLSYQEYEATKNATAPVLNSNEIALQESIAIRKATSAPAAQQGVSIKDIQEVAATTANAVMKSGQSLPPMKANISLQIDGREFANATLPDLRAVMASDPEVTDDR